MFDYQRRLAAREEPVRVGLVGAGTFGAGLADQLSAVDGVTVAGVADLDVDKAERLVRGTGATDVAIASGERGVSDAVAAERPLVTDDAVALVRSGVDVVVEATGIPDAAARHAYEAILADTHVVMGTVEADTVVGPALAELADRAGVVYSLAYGDQPALTVELVEWARGVGFEVVAAGQGREFVDADRYGTPDDALERFGFDEAYLADNDPNPRLYNSFMDGTKIAVESCAVANAAGLPPDTPGMHMPTAEIADLPEVFRPEASGGVLSSTGVVDVASFVHPDGTETETGFPFGVFVVVRGATERVRQHLHAGIGGGAGVVTSDDGEYALFYRPFHLPGVETGRSVAAAALDGRATGVASRRVAETVAVAKRDLAPGETIDGGGGTTVYGLVERAEDAAAGDHVPLELLDDAEVVRPVERDAAVTYDDVALDDDSFLARLRRLDEAR
jgi:predicted homoserine dehydrogenase-like protein